MPQQHPHPQKPTARLTDTRAEGILQVHDEAAGVLRLHILWPHEAINLFASATAGDAEAARLVRVVSDTLRRIKATPPDLVMECGACGRPLHGGAVICAAIPHRHDPTKGLAFALCRACTSDVTAVEARAVEAMKILWPDGRVIRLTHPAGGEA